MSLLCHVKGNRLSCEGKRNPERTGLVSNEQTMMDDFSHFDLAALSQVDSYKLLASVVLPRPIAWVVSRDAEGTLNAAPFSFFNIMSSDPPIVGISFARAPDREKKDTLSNILAHGEFVVNMVPEELAQAMNTTATNAPKGVDETQLAGLEVLPSTVVNVPRLAGSPVALECRLQETMNFGGSSTMCLGRIVYVHVRTSAFEDVSKLHIDPDKMRLIGRMHGGGGYTTTRDIFHIERKSWPLKD
jgi:flavin reductase (DIM6/NTAB) family NADH-FMN oxidoreductase RutF